MPGTWSARKKQYGGMMPSDARELKQLRDENSKLKRLVAELMAAAAEVAGPLHDRRGPWASAS